MQMYGNLVIVESPAKAQTIQKFLGKDFIVKSSFGHIRDLQDKKLSVEVDNNFRPEYVVPADKKKVVAELKKAASDVSTVWLASDEDREGEAISWHLFETLGLKKENTKRIVFHEITKNAIIHAIETPREIDMNLVDAQQARRVLDRLVGFELSPVLWRKIQPKLSAGRVQSVALRLVVDREKEIINFNREPFYKVEAVFHPESMNASVKIKASLDTKFSGKEEALKFLEDSKDATFVISEVDAKPGSRFPAPPFTTSTLQQEAARKLHFPVSMTMRVAQSLYEKGLITYMRTDSTNLSSLALGTSKEFIVNNFGENYSKPRNFKTKTKGAQEAHEAIRPTYIQNTEIEGSSQEQKLYSLIWKRTIASQMSDAKMLNTSIKVSADKRHEKFNIQASSIIFDGFLKVYMEGKDDVEQNEEEITLPEMKIGEIMQPKEINAICKFTQAPPRYSEATLVKKLEELGIGRPSTYAPTISTLTTERGYITKGDKEGEKKPVENLSLKGGKITETETYENIGSEKGRLLPNEIGMIVTDYLVKNFSEIMDYDFTANVEKDFDKIADGKAVWNDVIGEFYTPFHKVIDDTLNDKTYNNIEKELGLSPDGEKIVAKFGKWGPYIQKGEGEKRQYANLNKGQLIESITLEEALKLFQLPKNIGKYKEKEIIVMKGRFGPYLKFGDKNVSLPKDKDPLSVSLEECIAIIEDNEANKPENNILLEFKDSDILVINGKFGPYIKHDGKNFKIPKDKDAKKLTEEECREIIVSSEPAKRYTRRNSKK